MPRGEHTQRREAILDALRNSTTKVFTLADLVVAAFKRHPRLFCMDGYPQFPCSATVRNCLYGEGGLLARGYIATAVDNRYSLTKTGVNVTVVADSPSKEALSEIALKMNRMVKRGAETESQMPTCRNCGDVDALVDGYCAKPACEKAHRRSPT